MIEIFAGNPPTPLPHYHWWHLYKDKASALCVMCNGTQVKSFPPWRLWLWCNWLQGMRWQPRSTPTTQYPFLCNALYQIFLCSSNGIAILQGIALKTLWQGEHLDLLEHESVIEGWEGWALYPNDGIGTWPPMQPKTNILQCKILLPIKFCSFTSHTIGRFNQSNTYFLFLPFTQ